MSMTEHAVVIAGGGPTGLMLAGELALAGVDVAVVERRAGQELAGSRAGGLHSRTIEVLDQRGIADRFLAEGQVAQVTSFAGTPLPISDFPTRHPYALGLWQNHIERILAGWVGELAVTFYRGRDVTGFAQDDGGVDVALSDGGSLRAEYLVGCDGGRSAVRKAAGIEFAGWDATTSNLIAEVEMTDEPELGTREDARGIHGLGKVEYEIVDGEIVWGEGGPIRAMVTEEHVGTGEPTLRDLSDGLIAVYGTDFGVHSPTWISRFTDATRQAAAYRDRPGPARRRRRARALPGRRPGPQHRRAGRGEPRLEAGPGGQRDVAGQPAGQLPRRAPPGGGPRAAQHDGPDRAAPLRRPHQGAGRDRGRPAGHGRAAPALRRDAGRAWTSATTSATGHPLLGRRMPDLDLVGDGGPLRVYELLHDARPVLLDLGGGVDARRGRRVAAEYRGAWELPDEGAGQRPRRRADPARRLRRVGRRRDPGGPRRRAHEVVRARRRLTARARRSRRGHGGPA